MAKNCTKKFTNFAKVKLSHYFVGRQRASSALCSTARTVWITMPWPNSLKGHHHILRHEMKSGVTPLLGDISQDSFGFMYMKGNPHLFSFSS
jgi:hypothetical protein